MLLATSLATFGLLSQNPSLQHQMRSYLQPIQERLPPQLQAVLSQLGKFSLPRQERLFTAEELKQYTSDNPAGGGKLYMAILGEVFDVSAKPEFYGAGEGYGHFAGTDGSKSFITGDFVNDVTDDVSSLDAAGCHGLVGWLKFYHETYPRLGKLVGRFYDASGQPTAELASVQARAQEGKKLQEKEEDEVAKWPNCNSKWTEAEGGRVWCEGGRYPRKLYVNMVNGRPNWRCACFEELGWSDLRQVYTGCEPDEHSCSTDPSLDEAASKASDEAVMSLMNSL